MKITIKNKKMEPIARLENAYKLTYSHDFNTLWSASFRLPSNDLKIKHLTAYNWVEIEDGDKYIGMFQIMPKKTVENRETHEVTFTLRHALGTLLSKSLFRFHSLSNFDTRYVLQYLIDQQEEKHWKLGTVAFKRKFSYSWENDNLLSAIFSIPKPFDQYYQWTFDTTVYPFVLNLVEPDDEPVCRIKEGYNLIGFEINENPNIVFNRIYGLGSGEGRNQLSVEKINGGKPYVENKASIAKYGLQEYVWPDKRFIHADNLLASMNAKLKEWAEPKVTWEVRATDLSKLTGLSIDKFEMGKVVRIETKKYGKIDRRIMRVKVDDASSGDGEVVLSIGGVKEDLSTTQTDLEHRQQINELNAQGATTLLNDSYADNCDEKFPAKMDLYFDSDMVYINTVELTFNTKPFRAYSRAIKGGGAMVGTTAAGGSSNQTSSSGGSSKQTSSAGGSSRQTSSSGGATTQSSTSGGGGAVTSESGGSTTQSSTSGGGGTKTSSAGGDHHHILFNKGHNPGTIPHGKLAYSDGFGGTFLLDVAGQGYTEIRTAEASGSHSHTISIPAHKHNVSIPAHSHKINLKSHSHSVSIPAHTHDVIIPDHTHSVTIPSHTHTVQIPSHKHEITLPDHEHEIDYGIMEDMDTANKIRIKIDGREIPLTATSGERIDIVDYLEKEKGSGDIVRGNHTIELLPNKRARIEAKVYARVFIQSQIGGKF